MKNCSKESLLVVSEFLTISQIEDAHKRAVGRPLPSAPKAIGWGIHKGSSKARDLMWVLSSYNASRSHLFRVAGLELNHKSRLESDPTELNEKMQRTSAIIDLQSYEDWKARCG